MKCSRRALHIYSEIIWISTALEFTLKPAVNISHYVCTENTVEGWSRKTDEQLIMCLNYLFFHSCYNDVGHLLKRAPVVLITPALKNLAKYHLLYFLWTDSLKRNGEINKIILESARNSCQSWVSQKMEKALLKQVWKCLIT